MKIVINRGFASFNLSEAAILLYAKKKNLNLVKDKKNSDSNYCNFYINQIADDSFFSVFDIKRDDPALVETVETLGQEANGRYSKLKIIDIPDDVDWCIQEYDGLEWIAEKHRTWR